MKDGRYMKIRVFCLMTVACFCLGCGLAETKDDDTDTGNQVIATQLLEQFDRYAELVMDEPWEDLYARYLRADEAVADIVRQIDYHLMMATDAYIGLTGVYKEFISREEADHILSVADQLPYQSVAPIYFGYTASGLKVIALSYTNYRPQFSFLVAQDYIRGNDREGDLLFEMNEWALWDLYVEDLVGNRKVFQIDVELYGMDGGKESAVYSLKVPTFKERKQLFKEYERVFGNTKYMRNKRWNLVMPDYPVPLDSMVGIEARYIRMTVDGEPVMLENTMMLK